MARQRTIKNVPDDMVEQVVGDFQSEGATVVKKKQPDGRWTVIATYP